MSDTPQNADPAKLTGSETSSEPVTPPAAKPSPETLKAAYKAFKKRIKVTTLDHNSRLGKSPMTSGSSELTAITPPAEYPRAVWQALVDEGKLKYAGQGMYGLR